MRMGRKRPGYDCKYVMFGLKPPRARRYSDGQIGGQCKKSWDMFRFKAIRTFARGYKLINGTGHGGHGWDFPAAIREMDMILVENDMLPSAEHEKRVEVLLALSAAFERENPDVETSTILPHMWAMAIFTYSLGLLMKDKGFGTGSAAAAMYGIRHRYGQNEIEWSERWALEQLTLKKSQKETSKLSGQ
jgi:hypothetical protein